MEIQEDFKELLGLFNAHRVEYVIVGGYALAHHGVPRFTGDLDIVVRPNAENAERVMAVLEAFGFGDIGLSAQDFQAPEKVVQLGYPPVRIDILTSLSGLSEAAVFETKEQGDYGGVPAHYIGRQALIENKRALGRLRDLADIEALAEQPGSDT